MCRFSRRVGDERVEQEPEVGFGHWFSDAERFWLVVRAVIGAKEQVEPGREVGVVPGVTVERVMPVMQRWRADHVVEWSERQLDVGVNKDRPQRAKRHQAERGLQIES